jgi:hypothetical protein
MKNLKWLKSKKLEDLENVLVIRVGEMNVKSESPPDIVIK